MRWFRPAGPRGEGCAKSWRPGPRHGLGPPRLSGAVRVGSTVRRRSSGGRRVPVGASNTGRDPYRRNRPVSTESDQSDTESLHGYPFHAAVRPLFGGRGGFGPHQGRPLAGGAFSGDPLWPIGWLPAGGVVVPAIGGKRIGRAV